MFTVIQSQVLMAVFFYEPVEMYPIDTCSSLLHCQIRSILTIQQLPNDIHVKFLHCHLTPSSKLAIHYVMEALNRRSLFASQTAYAVTQLSGLVTNVRRCNVCMQTLGLERQRRLAVYRSFITRLIDTTWNAIQM